jgi:hypothetical protein
VTWNGHRYEALWGRTLISLCSPRSAPDPGAARAEHWNATTLADKSLTSAAWLQEYRASRRDLITANEGHHAVSVVGLLPNAPNGEWAAVSAQIASMRSPVTFLSHLFCEISGRGHILIAETPISLDGFLGSAHSTQDQWLLLPAMALWLLNSRAAASAAVELFRVVDLWEELLGKRWELPPSRLRLSSDLGPFLPHARVPRRDTVETFLEAVQSQIVERHASRTSQKESR